MKFTKRTLFLLLPLIISLSGCESELSVAKVCDSNPEFCDDLNTDSWCKDHRAEIIIGRFQEAENPTDAIRYKLITDYEQYSQCVELASQIEHIKLKEKKTSRINGYMTSLQEIARLSDATEESMMPELLFWHWSRNGSEQAIHKLLKMEHTGELDTPELQFKLATYHVKTDRNKTIDILYYALSLYTADQDPNPEILKTLSTLYLKDEKFKHAYVWGRIARKMGIEDIDLAPLRALLRNDGLNIEQLNLLADNFQNKIENGTFVPPKR
ncbi:DUF2989 domain-containing protein [Catenovulum sp. SM1970]|uniref:DUF2989 domain-containing protein n=1 Tax=Marinifaba aquimaris TaxID=2741323 RepID=UPI001571F96B|nr:DUF2989 domain-containing protein [Marinifaba aquimaris]NTS78538.1 DUF2989 domain-containing protein [Marinifaba aquimaris]